MKPMPFSKLFSGAWKLYTSQFKVSAAYSLLYIALPISFMIVGLFAVLIWSAQTTGLQTQGMEMSMAFFPLVAMLAAMVVLIGIVYVAMPIHLGRQFNLFSRAWHGFKLDLGMAFVAMRKRRLKAIVQKLIFYLYWIVVSMLMSIVQVVSIVPLFVGLIGPLENGLLPEADFLFFLPFIVIFLALTFFYCVYSVFYQLSLLAGINEGKWFFDGIGKAWKLFKRRPGAILEGYGIFFAIKCVLYVVTVSLALVMQIAIPNAELSSILFALLPIFCLNLFSPLENAFFTMVYYDVRVSREGYMPLLDDETALAEEALPQGIASDERDVQ